MQTRCWCAQWRDQAELPGATARLQSALHVYTPPAWLRG